ncbi:MAG: 50S ribosomal protein L30 [Gammaproteobacteria bacterium]|nr:50S ribosomal protein L30 [Pseudomonadota bacterium]TDJ30152.1 MAG: 50S ribosomal protein L30 [Gammaproteobacteria bacterium]
MAETDKTVKKAAKTSVRKTATKSVKKAVKKVAQAPVEKAVKTPVEPAAAAPENKAAPAPEKEPVKAAAKKSTNMLSVTLIRSKHGRLASHKACIAGLGLRRMHQTVQVIDTPENRGMVNKVHYLLNVEEV